MIELQTKELCTGCAACSNICPNGCISMKADDEGFFYPSVDEGACTDCGLCEEACPLLHYTYTKLPAWPGAVLAWSGEEEARDLSTSGGAVTAIAKMILKNGGAIVGALYDECQIVHHQIVDCIDEIGAFARSKYVQSQIGNIFQEVEERLNQGQTVFFCGTACQVYGLKCYLKEKGRADASLYTADLICRGTPSPKLLSEYVRWLETRHCSKVRKIMMREKRHHWPFFSDSTIKVEFTDGQFYEENPGEDYYSRFSWGGGYGQAAMRAPLRLSVGRAI